MKDKFNKFMQGRYGIDEFSRFTMGIAFVAIIITIFMKAQSPLRSLLDTIGMAAIIYSYFRILSRNFSKRYAENRKFLSLTEGIRRKISREKNLMNQRKTHHIYKCPNCKQMIRIPKGKGKIEISCPKCRTKFVKKS